MKISILATFFVILLAYGSHAQEKKVFVDSVFIGKSNERGKILASKSQKNDPFIVDTFKMRSITNGHEKIQYVITGRYVDTTKTWEDLKNAVSYHQGRVISEEEIGKLTKDWDVINVYIDERPTPVRKTYWKTEKRNIDSVFISKTDLEEKAFANNILNLDKRYRVVKDTLKSSPIDGDGKTQYIIVWSILDPSKTKEDRKHDVAYYQGNPVSWREIDKIKQDWDVIHIFVDERGQVNINKYCQGDSFKPVKK